MVCKVYNVEELWYCCYMVWCKYTGIDFRSVERASSSTVANSSFGNSVLTCEAPATHYSTISTSHTTSHTTSPHQTHTPLHNVNNNLPSHITHHPPLQRIRIPRKSHFLSPHTPSILPHPSITTNNPVLVQRANLAPQLPHPNPPNPKANPPRNLLPPLPILNLYPTNLHSSLGNHQRRFNPLRHHSHVWETQFAVENLFDWGAYAWGWRE